MKFIEKYEIAPIDRSELANTVYNNSAVIEDATSDIDAFLAQFDQLINHLAAVCISLGHAHDSAEINSLHRLKRRLRDTENLIGSQHAQVVNTYLAELKANFESFALLLDARDSEQNQEVARRFLEEIDVCGPGLLTHKQQALTTLTTGLSYRAELARYREGLISEAATAHINRIRLYKGNEIHVFNAIAQHLAQYHFYPLSPSSYDIHANFGITGLSTPRLQETTSIISNQYTPSNVIKHLAEYIFDQLTAFFSSYQSINTHTKAMIDISTGHASEDETKRRKLISEKFTDLIEALELPETYQELLIHYSEDYTEVHLRLPSREELREFLLTTWLDALTQSNAKINEKPLDADYSLISLVDNFAHEDRIAAKMYRTSCDLHLIKHKAHDNTHHYYFINDFFDKFPELGDFNSISALYKKGVKNFSGCNFKDLDLSQIQFSNCQFEYTCFSGTDLDKAYFWGCKFNGADFSGVTLDKARFDHCDFTGTDFSGADLRTVEFKRCKFANAQFIGTKINRETFLVLSKQIDNFKGADLSGEDLSGLDLRNCDFTDAYINELDIEWSMLDERAYASLYHAGVRNFRNVQLCITQSQDSATADDAKPLSVEGCKLDPIGLDILTEAGLRSFRGVDLSEQRRFSMNLKDHDFSGANFAGTNLSSTILPPELWQDCNFSNAQFPRNWKNPYSKFQRQEFADTLKAILQDYAQSRSWGKHHTKAVAQFLKEHDCNEMSAIDILTQLRKKIPQASINQQGSLMRRIRFAIEKHSCFNDLNPAIVLNEAGFDVPRARATSMPFRNAFHLSPYESEDSDIESTYS